MEFVQSEWRILTIFNQVYVIAKTPLTNSIVDGFVSQMVMEKVLGDIAKAETIGESKTLDTFPKEVQEEIDSIIKEGYTIVSFGVMFKDPVKAKEFVNFLRQQG